MIAPDEFLNEIKQQDLSIVSGVPCSYFKDLLISLESDSEIRYVPATREDEAIGVICGAYFGGKKGMVIMLDKGYFEMCMNDFGVYMKNLNSNCDIPTDPKVKEKYYLEFKNLENKRFAKIMNWLYKNWSYRSFPAIADFKTAFEMTSEGPQGTYKPDRYEKPQKNKKARELLSYIIRDVDLMSKLEKTVYKEKTGKDYSTDLSRDKTLKYWIPFIKEMFEKNMIYHIKKKVWEKNHSEADPMDYFMPRLRYPPNHKFIYQES